MSSVNFERTGNVGVVSLDGPPANALAIDLVAGVEAALDRARAEGVTVLVIASAVPGFFIAGADLALLGRREAAVFDGYLARLRSMIESIAAAPFLSIAAIDGHALGGGLELALACTLRVAGPDARLGVPEIKLGLLPGAGGTQRLPRLIGRAAAVDLLLSGRSAAPDEALRLGLVDRLADDAVGDAEEWAHELAQGPVAAYREIVRCVDASAADFAVGMDVERRAVLSLFDTPDGQEGVAAFLEKRRPRFGSSGQGGR